jgi:hypothetical protein
MSSSVQSQSVSRKFNDTVNVPDDVKKVVEQMIAEGNTSVTSQLINKLRSKYSDSNLVDLIIELLSEKVNKIQSRAQKFAQAIIKHSGENTPLHTLLKRALKYKEKLNLTDAEFDFFKINLHRELENTGRDSKLSMSYEHGNTNMSRALGTINFQQTEGVTVEQQDFPYLQEIIKQHAVSKPTHASVVVQSLLYRNFAGESMLGTYDQNKHNASCHVHPVVAAMILPKIKVFDETFLLANISYIVRCRYEKTPVMTSADYLLMYSLITDPTDVVCDIDSPFKDLRNRALLQETLWQSVLALRNGRYYDCVSAQFLSAIDNCKLSNVDAPDVIYVGDEATIMRRLLQAFSFRPMIVSTMPLYGVVAPNSANFPVMMNRVTAIPMITLRLPIVTNLDSEPVSLENSLSLPQYYMENNTLVPKVQTIIYTRGVMIFHVTRRTHAPYYQTSIMPHNWNNLLPTISSYERINLREVIAEPTITINAPTMYSNRGTGEHFLRSVVTLNVNPLVPDLIVGTSAIFSTLTLSGGLYSNQQYFKYDPQMAAIKRVSDGNFANASFESQNPVTNLYKSHQEPQASFDTLASRYGTIYIYVAAEDENDQSRNNEPVFGQ